MLPFDALRLFRSYVRAAQFPLIQPQRLGIGTRFRHDPHVVRPLFALRPDVFNKARRTLVMIQCDDLNSMVGYRMR
jgi:hypothetical protein